MAEEAKVTPEAETIAPIVEGTVESQIVKETPLIEDNKGPEVVPLSVYLSLKDDVKELKKEIKESKESKKPSVVIDGLKDLAEKYPDVNQEFMKDLLTSATSTAQNEIEKKYTPILEKQENEKKQLAFDKAFDNLFDKTLNDNPELPKTIDKDAIKALALTPKYRNVPLADILLKMYPSGNVGKASSENDMRSAADRIDDVVNFDKITPDQKKAIMEDPKARSKYFNWLDTQTGR